MMTSCPRSCCGPRRGVPAWCWGCGGAAPAGRVGPRPSGRRLSLADGWMAEVAFDRAARDPRDSRRRGGGRPHRGAGQCGVRGVSRGLDARPGAGPAAPGGLDDLDRGSELGSAAAPSGRPAGAPRRHRAAAAATHVDGSARAAQRPARLPGRRPRAKPFVGPGHLPERGRPFRDPETRRYGWMLPSTASLKQTGGRELKADRSSTRRRIARRCASSARRSPRRTWTVTSWCSVSSRELHLPE